MDFVYKAILDYWLKNTASVLTPFDVVCLVTTYQQRGTSLFYLLFPYDHISGCALVGGFL